MIVILSSSSGVHAVHTMKAGLTVDYVSAKYQFTAASNKPVPLLKW